MPDPQMQPAPRTSSVHQFGYDAANRELHMQFKSGPWIYVYSNIPPDIYSGLLKAEHPGQFHSLNIKGKKDFPFEKRRPVPPQL